MGVRSRRLRRRGSLRRSLPRGHPGGTVVAHAPPVGERTGRMEAMRRYKRCSECKGRIDPESRGPLALTCSEGCADSRKVRRQYLRRNSGPGLRRRFGGQQ